MRRESVVPRKQIRVMTSTQRYRSNTNSYPIENARIELANAGLNEREKHCAGPACQLLVTERSLGDSQVGLTMANCAMPLVTPSEAALGAASLTRIMLTL